MGVLLAYSKWLNYWDGLPGHCWRAEHEKNLVRQEVQVRLKDLAQRNSSGGGVLRGAYGSGKRALVRAAFQHPERSPEFTWVSGSYYGSKKPYGAIQFLLTGLEDHHLESPLAVYGHLKQHFGSLRGRPLIILEHVGLIDPLTNAVLCQLVSNRVIKLVVIDDLADTLPEVLSALVRSGTLETLQLNKLTLGEARNQICMMLDHSVSYLTAMRLWSYTEGSCEELRAVVMDCCDAGLFEYKGESAALRSNCIPVGVHMRQYAATQLDRLSLGRRQLLEHVAVEGQLPCHLEGSKQEDDIDFLFGRRLLEHCEGQWKITNPAIEQTLVQMRGDLNGWDDSQRADEGADALVANDALYEPASCQKASSPSWVGARREVIRHVSRGATAEATETVRVFLSNVRAEGETSSFEIGDARLQLLELLLSASRLVEAGELIASLSPADPAGTWMQLNLCQQYQALTLVTEYLTRTNDHEQALELLAGLLRPMVKQTNETTEYRFSPCMAPSLRSLINSTMALGQWESCRRLIQLVLAGSLEDMRLIAYVETAHVLLLGIAGNYVEAQKIIAPLQQQIHRDGCRNQQIFVDSVDLYIADRAGRNPLVESPRPSNAELECIPLLGLQCMWQSLGMVTRRDGGSGEGNYAHVEDLAQWAEERGEALTASHLWATVIRQGGFHAANRLRRLQEGRGHELADAFRMLSEGAASRNSQALAGAIGTLASLGFVAYANDDGSQIFQFMNPGQRRQASRKANNFMLSLQPDLIQPEVQAGLGRLTVLTEREKFVASAAASGLSNLEIAEQASVSVRTVEGHLYQVYSKLGISKRADLSTLAGQREMDTAR